jgi:predicted RNase H-like HicB family nuclease
MAARFVLSEYVEGAMSDAVYDKLEDGSFAGRIPSCKGVVAFGHTVPECEEVLRSTLEDWILLGLKLGHLLPVIADAEWGRKPIILPRPLPGHDGQCRRESSTRIL